MFLYGREIGSPVTEGLLRINSWGSLKFEEGSAFLYCAFQWPIMDD